MKPLLSFLLLVPALAQAGIFPPAAGQPGSQAVGQNDPDIDGWAVAYEQYNRGTHVDAEWRTPQRALGPAGNSDGAGIGNTFDIVSLGRGGSIVLSFSPPIANGDGFDFAVFENAITDSFLELARVEVSSDGITWAAFPAMSTVPAPVGGFGNVNPTDIEQVAGKYRGGFGTPFDLERLAGAPGVDLTSIRYVRLTDIVGDGSTPNGLTTASLANWLGVAEAELPQVLIDVVNAAPAVIYDPYPTVGSAGFDLDAIAVLEQGSVPASIEIDPFSSNPVDPESTRNLPVIVYSTSVANGDLDNFDATDINPQTVRFGYADAAPVAAPVHYDWDRDGLADAGYFFQIQDTGIACEDTSAALAGSTLGGIDFVGVGPVSTTECEAGCH